MKLSLPRESLLAPLQQVIGVIEKRQTLPILSNVLLTLTEDTLQCTGTDLEVELVSQSRVEGGEPGRVTVPARKLLDICRLLPERSTIVLETKGDRMAVRCGQSRYSLSTLPASNYPEFETGTPEFSLELPVATLRSALDKTTFAMAIQDVRTYLNGLLLDLDGGTLRTVASDGHRLALFEAPLEAPLATARQVIIPRKGVQELSRLLADFEESVRIDFSANAIAIRGGTVSFAVKLIEGRFPNYQRVIPQDLTRVYSVDRETLRSALTRVSVLSTERLKSISLQVTAEEELVLQAHTPDQEEAEERLAVTVVAGGGVTVGFNATYLLDAIGHIDSSEVKLSFPEAANSCLVEDSQNPNFRSIVMPMKL